MRRVAADRRRPPVAAAGQCGRACDRTVRTRAARADSGAPRAREAAASNSGSASVASASIARPVNSPSRASAVDRVVHKSSMRWRCWRIVASIAAASPASAVPSRTRAFVSLRRPSSESMVDDSAPICSCISAAVKNASFTSARSAKRAVRTRTCDSASSACASSMRGVTDGSKIRWSTRSDAS